MRRSVGEFEPLSAHIVDQSAHPWADQSIAIGIEHGRKMLLKLATSLSNRHSAFQQDGA
jgi:hypothetical protein